MTGTILDIGDFGSIVTVQVAADNGRIAVVPFDHRAFHWLLDAEQCDAADLIGRPARTDGETLEFLDGDL